MGQTAEWHEARRQCIGGSDTTAIMSGDWTDLWLVKTGRKASDDLSDVLPVQIGIVTETLNIAWYSRATGYKVERQGEQIRHDEHKFMGCTLDGYVADPARVVQCKHVNGHSKMEALIERYTPQVTHEMIVTGCSTADLSVFFDNNRHEIATIQLDPFFADELIERERKFWSYVERDLEPPAVKVAAPPPVITEFRKLDMTGNNQWAVAAGQWLEFRTPSRRFDEAVKAVKELVKADVGEAIGHGIVVKRSKAGSLLIKEV